jgi:hypothetical protein
VSLILTYTSFVPVLEVDTVPNVHVLLAFVTDLLTPIAPPNAQPFVPLPPPPAPGTPEPPYATLISNQPFAVDVLSIVEPGIATHIPAMLPVYLMSNFDKEVLTNLNVKY